MSNSIAQPTETDSLSSIRKKFNALRRKTVTAIFTERAVPKLLAPAIIGTGFLAATWVGLWTVLPIEAKIIGVIAFAAAAAVSPFLIKSGSLLLKNKEAIKRIDKDLEANHGAQNIRPAEIVAGRIGATAATPADELSKQIWRNHVQRVWNEWGDKMAWRKPSLNLNQYDPFKLRFIVPLCAALAGMSAGDARQERLQDAFNWQKPPVPEAPLDIIAWITPPDLPHLAPQYIDTSLPFIPSAPAGTEAAQQTPVITATEPSFSPVSVNLSAHEGSVLTIIIAGGDTSVHINGTAISPTQILTADEEDGESSTEYQIPLQEGEIQVQINKGPSWNFSVTPDENPEANITAIAPDEDNPASLNIICTAQDDFGLNGGRLILRVPGSADQEVPNAPASPSQTAEAEDSALDSAALPVITLPRGHICAP